jgi:hypothetical protein
MLSHSAARFIGFLTDVVGMEVQHSFRVPGHILETTLGWPPSEGADVTILGSGMAGLVEVLEVPEQLRKSAPEGLAALSFMAEDYSATLDRARQFTGDITALDTALPGVDLFICTVGGVSMEFMGSYQVDAMETAAGNE